MSKLGKTHAMTTLDKNWITEKLIDFEYKKYILLAYLKSVGEHFNENKLYPHLGELVEHYRQIVTLRDNKQSMMNAFPSRLSGIDSEKLKLSYEKVLQDNALMQEIESIIDFSIPKFQEYLAEGKKIYDFIEEHIHISPVGIISIYPQEGYLLLKDGDTSNTYVYQYQVTIFEQPNERYRAIHTSFIKSYSPGISNSFEYIKKELIEQKHELPNPATYAVECEMNIPLNETFLPLAKKALVKHLAA